MSTVILSADRVMTGRPLELGSTFRDENHAWVVFLGYDDQHRRVAVNYKDLERIIKNGLKEEYQVNVSVARKRRPAELPGRIKRLIHSQLTKLTEQLA
ncbi:MAG: hypothetical protein PHO56_02280 [Patescibacteria group bacterium]|nr:hypothetical protein [Patescibacteria group bacterium]